MSAVIVRVECPGLAFSRSYGIDYPSFFDPPSSLLLSLSGSVPRPKPRHLIDTDTRHSGSRRARRTVGRRHDEMAAATTG